jgi:hypothetical protein
MINNTISCICLLVFLLWANPSSAGNKAAFPYPLEKGNYWIYKGKVKWTPAGAGRKFKSKTLVWTMRIYDVIESPEYRIALVTGFPNDVAWYEEGMTPQYSLLVQHDNCVYWNGFANRDEAINNARLLASGADNAKIGNCIFDFPLMKGKKYDDKNENRTDNMYAWYVEGVKKVNINVKGFRGKKQSTEFAVIYRTLPDHIIIYFVPGLGITRYVYEHHGTVAFEDLRLIEVGKNNKERKSHPIG